MGTQKTQFFCFFFPTTKLACDGLDVLRNLLPAACPTVGGGWMRGLVVVAGGRGEEHPFASGPYQLLLVPIGTESVFKLTKNPKINMFVALLCRQFQDYSEIHVFYHRTSNVAVKVSGLICGGPEMIIPINRL